MLDNMETRKEFAKVMLILGAAFRTEPTKATMAVYFEKCLNHSIEALQHGANLVIDEDDHFPSVRRLKEAAREYKPPFKADLSKPAIEYNPPELAAERMAALLKALETGDFTNVEFGAEDNGKASA